MSLFPFNYFLPAFVLNILNFHLIFFDLKVKTPCSVCFTFVFLVVALDLLHTFLKYHNVVSDNIIPFPYMVRILKQFIFIFPGLFAIITTNYVYCIIMPQYLLLLCLYGSFIFLKKLLCLPT